MKSFRTTIDITRRRSARGPCSATSRGGPTGYGAAGHERPTPRQRSACGWQPGQLRQPKLRPAIWQITKVERNAGFTWTTKSPGLLVTGHHDIEPLKKGSASRVTLAVEFSGWLSPLVAWLTRRLNEEYLGIEAAGLKKRSEQESRPI